MDPLFFVLLSSQAQAVLGLRADEVHAMKDSEYCTGWDHNAEASISLNYFSPDRWQ